jgi:hypothetical protein
VLNDSIGASTGMHAVLQELLYDKQKLLDNGDRCRHQLSQDCAVLCKG